MPIYEYLCRNCHQQFELLVRDSLECVCPACQSADLERLVSSFAVTSPSARERSVHSKRLEQRPAARDKAIAEYQEFKRSHD
jgi:putative FmdB family regulatory protein